MRAVTALICCLAACSFTPGRLTLGDDDPGPIDAADHDATVDTMPDASPDAMVPPSTTDHVSVADTHLCETGANTNYNGQTSALVDGTGNFCVIAMRFDLSAIPTTAVITAAVLDLWTDTDPGGPSTLYALTESWVESEVTWNSRSTGTAWTTAGAAPPSRGTTAIASLPTSTASTEYTATVTTATVQGWVTTPATNVGLVFVTTDANGTRWATREHGTASHRPVLRVTHVP